jgi:hypothetical protein
MKAQILLVEANDIRSAILTEEITVILRESNFSYDLLRHTDIRTVDENVSKCPNIQAIVVLQEMFQENYNLPHLIEDLEVVYLQKNHPDLFLIGSTAWRNWAHNFVDKYAGKMHILGGDDLGWRLLHLLDDIHEEERKKAFMLRSAE